MTRRKKTPPAGVSSEAKKLWQAIVADYGFDSDAAGLSLLQSLCECLDRLRQCQKAVAEDGLTVIGSSGQIRPHPLLAVESECRRALLAHYRALKLEPEEAY